MVQFSQMAGAHQFMEDGAQRAEPSDAGGGRQGRSLRTQVRHPAKDMRIAAQLVETSDLRVFVSEIDEEDAHHDGVVALTGRSKWSA